MSSTANPETSLLPTRSRLRWGWLLLGASLGLVLGVGIGYFSSAPAFGSNPGIGQTLLLIGIEVALLVTFAVLAAIRSSVAPMLAAAAMVATSVLGVMVAPGAPGSSQHASGTGSAGTRQDPTAFWSGSVTCSWQKDQDASVKDVAGFDVRLTDAAIATELGLSLGDKVVAITLGGGVPSLGVGEDATHYMGRGTSPNLTFKNLSANGRTGMAVATNPDIVFAWSCSRGP